MNNSNFDERSKKNILWFKEIHKEDVPLVGGKGANLGEMVNANLPIPYGFVVTAQAYIKNAKEKGILKKIVEIEQKTDVNDIKELNRNAKKIREIIKKAGMEKEIAEDIKKAYKELNASYVAVRSSATAEDLPNASFAGQQETFLNVKGEKELINKVIDAWASLFTARAMYYRKKQNFDIEKVAIAIVVQKMVESEVSGIAFTANPVNNNRDEIVIEAGFGLGEAIVSGSVTPDTYIYSKSKKKIISKEISDQEFMIVKEKGKNIKKSLDAKKRSVQKLEDKKIIELAKICERIEKHYKKPMDIEWALEKNKLYIVQARAITTLKKDESKEKSDLEGKVILEGLAASPGFAFGPVKVILDIKELYKVEKGDILVAKMTTPDMVPAMKKAGAIITDEGGITSHAAIVSRELGIPAIVGTKKATSLLKDKQKITVDAVHGKVYEGFVAHKESKEINTEHIVKDNFILATKIKVNVAMPESAERASKHKVDGVGLLRAEHMIASKGVHPAYLVRKGKDEELKNIVKEGIKEVAKHFKNKPVYYRTFDARTDEFTHLKGGNKEPKESNPMLGWHGIRRDLDDSRMLKAEFRAIKELYEEGYKNICVMIPFTIRANEFKEALKIAESIGLTKKMVLFGIMVETPAAALSIDEYIEAGIDFVSFGTNDLTQLTLGIDRNNEKIQKLFDETHKAVLKLIAYVIKKCKKANVRTSICGQAASRPEMIRYLIRFGIDSLSVNIDAIEKTKEIVAIEEKKLILETIRNRDFSKDL